ncbi:MAG: serine hydrolase domain-containing protein [Pseudomonadota bacterium]
MSFSACFSAAIGAIALSSPSPFETKTLLTDGIEPVIEAVSVTAAPERSLENLEPFVDGVIGGLMESRKVAGVTVAVVYDGEIALTKGYGYADAARLTPVDPNKTLFRPGSISKTFTWTAVMQLAEQGKVDLDTDVNNYLTQFQIPDMYDEPVTLRHILSHTAGFEDGGIGYLFAEDVEQLRPVAEFLEKHMPARVRAPGTYGAYSNWASALAGVIVANQSEMEFDTYIDKNIFEPLGMRYSTFREPVPDDIAAGQSESLTRRGGEYADAGFEYIHNFAGAGSMSTTAGDMARYMLAHLGDGSYEGGRILSPQMTKQMREPLHRQHEAMTAMLYGFFEYTQNGRFAYGHGGSTLSFHSKMTLMPQEGVGIFISTNSPGGGGINSAFEKAFFDQYFPPITPYPHSDPTRSNEDKQEAAANLAKQVREYVGAYRTNRRAYTDYQKPFYVLRSGDLVVQAAANGGVLFGGGRYIEEKKDVFVSVDNPDNKVIFGRDADGAVNYIFMNSRAPFGFERISFWDQARTHYGILGFGLLISIGVFCGSVWAFPKWVQMTDGEKLSRSLVFGSSLAFLLAYSVLAGALGAGSSAITLNGIDNLHIILTLCLAGALLALAALPALGLAWARGYWSLFGRLRHTVVVIALLATTWSLYYWNLIGPWNA